MAVLTGFVLGLLGAWNERDFVLRVWTGETGKGLAVELVGPLGTARSTRHEVTIEQVCEKHDFAIPTEFKKFFS